MQTTFTLRCIQRGEKCSFISLLAPNPFNKYKFSIKILSSSVKVILFIYITTVVCQGAWLPWKPYSWYSTHTKLFEFNQSATEWRCLVWKIIMGELILMNLCQPALEVQFFLRHSVHDELFRPLLSCIFTDFHTFHATGNRNVYFTIMYYLLT